ncbi:transmembrane protein 107 isoform X2 [Dipodomys merriami]|uniref:transmembrane protein 107 isoform X2 n=1 Tax=Dipodomys merriami TaxID=94247 RepID=UPI00385587D4
MGRISGLVPSRFLTLLAHLVVVITLFWSRQYPGLPASPVHSRGISETGHPAGDSARRHPGPLCSGTDRFSFWSFHVQQHSEPHLYPFFLSTFPHTIPALPAVTEMALLVAVFGLKKKPF